MKTESQRTSANRATKNTPRLDSEFIAIRILKDIATTNRKAFTNDPISDSDYLHSLFFCRPIPHSRASAGNSNYQIISQFPGGREKWKAALAAIHTPPPDNRNLLGWFFGRLVELLAWVEPSLFTLMVKLAFSSFLASAAMFWLWRNHWRHRGFMVVACIISFFIGLWVPMSWAWIDHRTTRAFVVLLLFIILTSFCWILPFFWTPSKRGQKPLRLAVGITFVGILGLHAILKLLKII